MTRRHFARIAAIAGTTPLVRADERRTKAEQLIDKTLNALGGDAFRTMVYRTEIGRAYSFYHEKISGLSAARIYTKFLPVSSPAPIRELQCQVLGKKQEESVIFTEKDVWDVTFRGAKNLSAERLNSFRESTLHDVFYILRERLSEPGLGFEYHGTDVIENQSAEKVEIYDDQNRSVMVWLSATSFHPIQQSFSRWDPTINERRQEVTQYSNYRPCGNGVTLPWVVERDRDKERIFQLYSTHVSVDQPIPDSMFEPPTGLPIRKE